MHEFGDFGFGCSEDFWLHYGLAGALMRFHRVPCFLGKREGVSRVDRVLMRPHGAKTGLVLDLQCKHVGGLGLKDP